MKRYWLILFLLCIIIFQFYLFSWNKTQTVTQANQQNFLVNTSISSAFHVTATCSNYIIYPHATVLQNKHTYNLSQTGDNPYQVTNWYINSLITKNFLILSHTTDTTNGTNSYMIVAEKLARHISIIIGKGPGETATTIFIRDDSC